MATLARDRLIVAASLAALAGISWAYLLDLAFDMKAAMPGMDAMEGMAAPAAPPLAAAVALASIMWAAMMAGMMLPSATPMILLFATVQRRQGATPVLTTMIFVAGYLLVWGGFSIAAAGLQVTLGRAALLTPLLALTSTRIAGFTFLLAAAYELSPWKSRCVVQCASPLAFVTSHWRPGRTGALAMGIAHGAFCVGCCWALMLLLFTAGVMNLLWVALLAGLVLLQKALPRPRASAVLTAAALAAVGVALLLR